MSANHTPGYIECSNDTCEAKFKSTYWDNIRAHSDGWFVQKDGTAHCPEHLPGWVPAWRARKLQQSITRGEGHGQGNAEGR